MGKLTPEQAAKNRERQRKWRERAFKDPDGHRLNRVNVALDTHAAAALKRLSEGYSLTHRELFERLLRSADSEIADTIGHERQAAYYDGHLEPGALGAFDLEVRRAPAPGAALLSDDRHADDEIVTGKSHVNLDADGDTEATNADTAAEIEAGTDPEAFALAPSKLSQAERERLVLDTHRQGHGSRAIAKLTGIGESTARLILKRHGLANEQRAPMPD